MSTAVTQNNPIRETPRLDGDPHIVNGECMRSGCEIHTAEPPKCSSCGVIYFLSNPIGPGCVNPNHLMLRLKP